MGSTNLPPRVVREQVASTINLIVQVERLRDGSRKVVQVSEVVGMESEVVTLQDLFVFDHRMGEDEHGRVMGVLRSTGLRPKFLEKLTSAGVHLDPGMFAFERFGAVRGS